jgi:HSP20 family protein
MGPGQDLQVQEKRELQKKDETTIPARTFVPTTDIFETNDALKIVMEMPGVDKANLDVNVENDVLSVSGRIDLSKYEKLQPVYTEYNIGHYRRTFNVSSSRVDQDRIAAEMNISCMSRTCTPGPTAPARAASTARASARDENAVSFRHSSRRAGR